MLATVTVAVVVDPGATVAGSIVTDGILAAEATASVVFLTDVMVVPA